MANSKEKIASAPPESLAKDSVWEQLQYYFKLGGRLANIQWGNSSKKTKQINAAGPATINPALGKIEGGLRVVPETKVPVIVEPDSVVSETNSS